MRVPRAKMTAAAATGPASGLIPASSTPATCATPLCHSAVSKRSIVRSRWPSARLARRRRATAARIARAPGAAVGDQRRLDRRRAARGRRPRSAPSDPPAAAGVAERRARRGHGGSVARALRAACGVRPERRQLEVLAKLVARLGGLVARLLDAARRRSARRRSAGRRPAPGAPAPAPRRSRFAASAASARVGQIAGGLDHRRRAAPRRRAASAPARRSSRRRSARSSAAPPITSTARLRPATGARGIVARHRAGLGQPARDGLFAVLQPVQRRVRQAHLLLRRRRRHLVVRQAPRRRLGRRQLGRGHHARIAGLAPFRTRPGGRSAPRLPRPPVAPAGRRFGGGQATAASTSAPASAREPPRSRRLGLGVAARRALGLWLFRRHRGADAKQTSA